MKNRSRTIFPSSSARLRVLALASLSAILLGVPHAQADDRLIPLLSSRHIVGTWYIALDVGPFAPPFAGLSPSGLAHFHSDRTFMFSDAGDFGAESFLGTVATPQYGAWTLRRSKTTHGWEIVGTALHLEGRKDTGEPIGWNKVHAIFRVVNRNRLEGTVNVFFLPCDESPPIPTPLTCPDPIANAGDFMPNSPPDVPLTLTRVVVGE